MVHRSVEKMGPMLAVQMVLQLADAMVALMVGWMEKSLELMKVCTKVEMWADHSEKMLVELMVVLLAYQSVGHWGCS